MIGRSPRLLAHLLGATLAFLGVSLAARVARADVSSWLFLGGGPAWLSGDAFDTTRHPGAMRLELGLGSPPTGAVVVGALAKSTTFFGYGSDLSLVARGATGGFVRGGWGFAVDAGGYERWWGAGSSGFQGALVLGAPWGLQASLDYEQGTHDVKTYSAFLGVDFLRLTVYRTTGTAWLPNPSPAVTVAPQDR